MDHLDQAPEPQPPQRWAERLVVIEAADEALDGMPAVLWQADGAGLVATLSVADRVARRAESVRYAVVAEAVARGEVAASQAGSVHQWVRERAPGLAGDGLGSVVKAVEVLAKPDHAAFDVAVRAGRVSPAVGLVCAREWEALQTRVCGEAAPTVREALIAIGERDGAREVRRLRPALLARYGLDGEFQESQDALAARVALSSGRGDETGMTTYEFTCDPEGAAVLESAIGPLTRPVPDPVTGEPDPRTVEQRRGRALVESLRRAAQVTSGAGSLAGAKATLVVAMDLDDLKARIGAGTVLTSTVADTLLAPETVRRLACDAQIIPAVLGGPSSVLDWGETQRLFQPAQVKALWLRDRGCTFPGCSAPAAWCDAHHVRHWVDGGPTDLSNATLLCGRHHTIVHRDQLTATIDAGGVNWHTAPEPARWPDTVTGAPGPTRHRNRHRR